MPGITPFLWFDTEAEAAARFYVSVFPNSRITGMVARNRAVPVAAGNVLTVSFELDGRKFVALNGGDYFRFSEAVSFVITCRDQDEIDRYWEALTEGGAAQKCGWLKDRFGLSWQVVPEGLAALLSGPGAVRVTAALLEMTKLDVATLEEAAAT